MNIINLTPHELHFYAADGETLLKSILSSGIARAMSSRQQVGEVEGIPVNQTIFGSKITGLPEQKADTIYVVSVVTAQASKISGRDDVYIVDDAVRDSNGKIIGVKALAQI